MRIRSVITYTVLRLLAFLVPFALLMLLPIFQELWWLAAIFAALIGLSLSLIFLRVPLSGVSQTVHDRQRRRNRTAREEDMAAEDAEVDAADERTDKAESDDARSDDVGR